MGTVSPLHHINGGTHAPDETTAVQCSNCRAYLGSERAVAYHPTGAKFFCKMEPGDKAEDSCYLQWRMRHH